MKWNSLEKRISGLLGIVVVLAMLSATTAMALPFAVGDVFAGTGNGKIDVFDSTGVFKQTLDTTSGSPQQTGMCFDAAGNLYATDFTAGNMAKFDNNGGLLMFPWGVFSNHPESCVVDAADNIYVGEVFSPDLLKFNANGQLLATFSPAIQNVGVDWIDLAADQNTIFYTSEGNAVKRFDVGTNSQLQDFATLNPSEQCYALRIRTNGDVLVACSFRVVLLDSTGGFIRDYPSSGFSPPATANLFAMNLDPDGTSFWTAVAGTGDIYRIRISDGVQLSHFIAPPRVDGLAIFGEPTVGQPGFTVMKDFRFTNVNSTATPAQLGTLLPQNGSKYNVSYVTTKSGTVLSTNPGQLYGVITINGIGVSNVTVNDTFGAVSGPTQFMVNPAKLGGGVEVLRVNTTIGNAVDITDTTQITSATVDNAAGTVNLTINLTTPLASDENLMIYVKFITALKGKLLNTNDFVNTAVIITNLGTETATATINFVKA